MSMMNIKMLVMATVSILSANAIHFLSRKKESRGRLWYFKLSGPARYVLNAWYVALVISWVLSVALHVRYFHWVVIGWLIYINISAVIHRVNQTPDLSDKTVSEETYKRILDLYKAGKKDEAKRLAKSELSSPAEFREAWQHIKEGH